IVHFRLDNKIIHPGSTAFAGTRKIISVKQAEWLTVFFKQLIHFYIFVVNWNICSWLKCNAIKFLRGIENSFFQNVVQFKIGLYLVFVKIVFLFANHFGIIVPIPRFQNEILPLRLY